MQYPGFDLIYARFGHFMTRKPACTERDLILNRFPSSTTLIQGWNQWTGGANLYLSMTIKRNNSKGSYHQPKSKRIPVTKLFIHFLILILAPGWTQKLVIPPRFHSLGIKFWNKENKILIDSKIYKDWLVAKTLSECLPKRIFYFLFHRENLDNKIREQIKKKLKMQI